MKHTKNANLQQFYKTTRLCNTLQTQNFFKYFLTPTKTIVSTTNLSSMSITN